MPHFHPKITHHHDSNMKQKQTLILFLASLLWFCLLHNASAGEIQVSARISQQEIYLGQPFTLTLVIRGADEVTPPDLTNFTDLQSQFLGKSHSSNISIFNGRRESSKTYELNYQLTVKNNIKAIPAFTITADGKSYTTQPIPISTKQPEENDYFKLEVQLSKPTAYVGEPLLMTTTWLIGQKARGGGFNLPILSDPRFSTSIREDLLPPNKKQLIQLELAGQTILAKQYQKRVGNRDFMAITFFHTLIPKTAGDLTLPQGTIAVNALTGQEPQRSRHTRDPFDMWGNRQREIYTTLVVPANPVSLKVLNLPRQNVPPNFTGLVGQYTIAASATPTTVNVGDPINLTLTIAGQSLDTVTMPPLSLDHFKISNDPPKRNATSDTTTFTTTIRAKDEQVQQIPAISISFFNPEKSQYETTATKPIPITVRATRIITANDALGGDGEITPKPATPKKEVHQGIHYNYSDIQESKSPTTNRLILWAGLLIPPMIFLLVILLNRETNTAYKTKRKKKQRALKQLKKDLGAKAPGAKAPGAKAPFEAWLTFIGNELDRPALTISTGDVLPHLDNHPELATQTQAIFKTGEAMKYGGSNDSLDPQDIINTATKLHKVLK